MVAHLPTDTLPQKRGGLPAQTPSLCWSANLSPSQAPQPARLRGTATEGRRAPQEALPGKP